MKPLPTDIALNYEELAEQPLLLLLLALYDADINALQHRSASLGRTELYERLLKDFVRREVRKHSPALSDADLEQAVEAELLRLSIVAFAIFNRRSQWVSQDDLDADFSVLLIDGGSQIQEPGRLRTRLTVAQLTVGRFFFVHESRTTYYNRQLRTYEFLHATFGEFLVARLTVGILTEIITTGPGPDRSPQSRDGSGMLHALLSFAALTVRNSVVAFVGDMLDQLNAQQRAGIADLLLHLHTRALFPYGESAYDRYEPLALTMTVRLAAWSANLVLLAVLASGEITGAQLFPQELDPGMAWRNEAGLWRSQLPGYGLTGLIQTIALNRVWNGQRREIRLRRNDGTYIPQAPDIFWTYNISPGSGTRKGIFTSQGHNSLMMQRRINFASTMTENIMAHTLAPLVSPFLELSYVFVTMDDGRVLSAIHALLSALYAPYGEDASRDFAYSDLAHVAYKLTQDPGAKRDNSYLKTALGILISAVEQGTASPASLEPLIGLVGDTATEDAKLTELLTRLNDLGAS